MRTAFFTIAALLALLGAFYFFVWQDQGQITLNQNTRTITHDNRSGDPGAANPDDPAGNATSIAATNNNPPPALDPDAPLIAAGENVWVKTRDPNPPYLVRSEFRAARYIPRKDGTVEVISPETRFYGDDGRIISLQADRGLVIMPAGSSAGNELNPAAAQTPSRGQLEGVTIRYLESIDLPPILTATVPSLVFDATAYRLSTGQTVIDGVPTEPSRVPVTVSGLDYQFEGTGLTIHWNELRGRLDLLEIAHGKRLLIRQASRFLPTAAETNQPAAHLNPNQHNSNHHNPSHTRFVQQTTTPNATNESPNQPSIDDQSAEAVKAARLALRGNPWYRVWFERDIRILVNTDEIARGDTLWAVMQLDAQLPADKPNSTNPSSPANPTKPTSHPSSTDRTQTPFNPHPQHHDVQFINNVQPFNNVRLIDAPSDKSGDPSGTAPKAQPSPAQPLEIFWSGKLQITPHQGEPGQAFELRGSPARVAQAGTVVEAGALRSTAGGRGIAIEPLDPTQGLVIRSDSPDGQAELRAMRIDADADTGLARFIGPAALISRSRTSDPNRPFDETTLTWSGDGSIEDDKGLRVLALNGDVKLDHSQFAVASDSLRIGFASPNNSKPNPAPDRNRSNQANAFGGLDVQSIRAVIASGKARMRTPTATLEAGNISAILETSQTPNNTNNPRTALPVLRAVQASDNVHFDQSPQPNPSNSTDASKALIGNRLGLRCDNLDARFAPPASDSASSERSPIGDIESVVATGRVMLSTQRDNAPLEAAAESLTLAGTPGRTTLRLTGPEDRPARLITPEAAIAGVQIDLDEAEASVRIPGPGHIEAIEPANGRTIKLTWRDALLFDRTNSRVDATGKIHLQAITDTDRLDAHADRLQGRLNPAATASSNSAARLDLQDLSLIDNVDIRITSTGQPSVLLQTQRIDIDPARRALNAPGAGRILIENFELAINDQTQSTNAINNSNPAAKTTPNPNLASAAIAWRDGLTWDAETGRATWAGDVRIGTARFNESPTRVFCDRVTATLKPLPSIPTTSATNASTLQPSKPRAPTDNSGVSWMAERLDLRSLEATGEVRVRGPGVSFDAGKLLYDATTGFADALADGNRSVEVYTDDGTGRIGFGSLRWDVATGELRQITDIDARTFPR